MTNEQMIRELRAVAEKHRGKQTHTFDTNINLMATETANRIESLCDEINRQKEEIDVWRSAYDVAYSTNTELYGALKTARAETAKEFAEGLKETAMGKVAWDEYDDAIYGFVTVDEIDNRVKEFTEETT